MKTKQMGRPRTGSLYWVKSGWRARLTVDVDGERIQKSYDLGTHSKAAARIKMKRLLESTSPPTQEDAQRFETFREAALRIVEASEIASKSNRLGRLRLHVFEHLGDKPVDKITASDVREVLDGVAAQDLSRDLVIHVKNDVGAVLGELWRTEVLAENVVARVKVPKAKIDRRERAVLSDEELARYLAWEHPDSRHAMGVLERQTMACLSRMFGGLRAGDLRVLHWDALETKEGSFTHGWAPRVKTARPQLLEVPEMLRPILRDWWERHGRPGSGVVFPARKGQRAGKQKGRGNLAASLRRDLRRAFGVEVPRRVEFMRSNGRKDFRIHWDPARELTARERELFEETEFTKPVDFHSFRRAFKQALADAGVELQTAMALSGASDAKAHQRYLANTSKMRRLPLAALPTFSMGHAKSLEGDSENQLFSRGRNRDRTCDFNRVKVTRATVGHGHRHGQASFLL